MRQSGYIKTAETNEGSKSKYKTLGKTTKIKQELNDKESLTEEQDKSIPGRLN